MGLWGTVVEGWGGGLELVGWDGVRWVHKTSYDKIFVVGFYVRVFFFFWVKRSACVGEGVF